MTTTVGLFGLLGSGNLGNDGSMQAVLGHLRTAHPEARLHALCGGPEQVTARYGVPATRLNWNTAEYRTASGVLAVARKLYGKVVDVFRTASWVRRQDVVIVPGMGVLESALPLRPWGFPYSLLLVTAMGRLFGTKVVLLGVGADRIADPVIRRIMLRAAKLATYRSYRDRLSRDALRDMGLDTSRDPVHADLAFALPTPAARVEPGSVGVGVMAFRGGNGDRDRAEEIYRDYVAKLARFVDRLVADGRRVRLFVGDRLDEPVVAEIMAVVPAEGVSAVQAATLDELLAAMAEVETVVASRYHNVLCALKLAKPTVSIGYAAKNDVLMAELGLAEFCQPVRELDVGRLVEQFAALQARHAQLHAMLVERNRVVAGRVERQFAELSALLAPAGAGVSEGVG